LGAFNEEGTGDEFFSISAPPRCSFGVTLSSFKPEEEDAETGKIKIRTVKQETKISS